MITPTDPMSNYIEYFANKIVRERIELYDRVQSLINFTATPQYATLDKRYRKLILKQIRYMRKYLDVLNKRVELKYND